MLGYYVYQVRSVNFATLRKDYKEVLFVVPFFLEAHAVNSCRFYCLLDRLVVPDFEKLVADALSEGPEARTARAEVYALSETPGLWKARFAAFDAVNGSKVSLDPAISLAVSLDDEAETIELLLALTDAKTPTGFPRRRVVRAAVDALETLSLSSELATRLEFAAKAATISETLSAEPLLAGRLLRCASSWCESDPASYLLALSASQAFDAANKPDLAIECAKLAAQAPGATRVRALVVLVSIALRDEDFDKAQSLLDDWSQESPADRLARGWLTFHFANLTENSELAETALLAALDALADDPQAPLAIGLRSQAVIAVGLSASDQRVIDATTKAATALARAGDSGFPTVEALTQAGDVELVKDTTKNLPPTMAAAFLARATLPHSQQDAAAFLDSVQVAQNESPDVLVALAQAATEVGHKYAGPWSHAAVRESLDGTPPVLSVATMLLTQQELASDDVPLLARAAALLSSTNVSNALPALLAIANADADTRVQHWVDVVDLLGFLAEQFDDQAPLLAFLGALTAFPFNLELTVELCDRAKKDPTLVDEVEALEKKVEFEKAFVPTETQPTPPDTTSNSRSSQ